MSVIKVNVVNNVPFPPFVDQKRVDDLADCPLRPDDVFLVTHIKAGTTWLQQIAKLIKLNGQVGTAHIYDTCPWIEFIGRDAATAMPSPRFLKSHLPYHMMPGGDPAQSVAKYIYAARNPKDVAVSLYYHSRLIKPLEFTGDWNCFFELFMEGKNEYGLWFDHVLEWWKHRDADNILFLKYEDMKKDLPGAVEKISQFMGYNLDVATIQKIAEQSTFESMKADPLADPEKYEKHKGLFNDDKGTFLRKGVVGDWKNHFTDEQSARLDAEYAKRMAGSDLEFSYE